MPKGYRNERRRGRKEGEGASRKERGRGLSKVKRRKGRDGKMLRS
jgi:hypothetical protein